MPSLFIESSKWWDSPYINHFISADTIVANPSRPQNLNRYAYVANNPIRNTDPSGHKCVGDPGECLSEDGNTGGGFTNGDSPTHHFIKTKPASCGANHPINCDGTPQQTISEASGTMITTPANNDFSSISAYLQYMNNAYDFVHNLGVATRLGEKGFLWSKAINPDPSTDFVLGAMGQSLSDADHQNLTLGQRIARAGIVGGESMLTGYASDVAGAVGFLGGEAVVQEGGGVVGYAVASVAISIFIDTKWSNYNQQKFGEWGLGSP